ncbi:M28 family peptidase [Paraperlucidibaca sp.]|jgi:hypothetical protein|uniref:M28 family peptidase n=1 Tax=Paraperlucidibaca sp. TaxID=2708021 RepID=UPI003989879D
MNNKFKILKCSAIASIFLMFSITGCGVNNDSGTINPESLLSPSIDDSDSIVRDPLLSKDPMNPNRLHSWVRELTTFQPRWAGYPEEHRATKWLAQRLTDAGLNVKVEPYTFRKWELSDWEVQLIEGEAREKITSFPIWSTHGGSGTAELVYVGFGSEQELLAQDISGKAVVVTGRALINVFSTYPETYQRAAELGAVAMFVTSDAPDNLIRPTSSGDNRLDDNPIPAFQLGAQDLAKLRDASRKGGLISWKLDARHVDGTTHDVVARLPGSGKLEGTILICAHYDAWFSGALDNATGVAGLIGLAEHFAALPIEERPRDILFLGVTGHDAGYPHGGVNHWLATNEEEVPNLELFVNLDHLAAHGSEHVSGTGIFDMLGIVLERPLDEERALFTTHHPALLRTFLPYVLQYTPLTIPLPTIPEINANNDLEGAMGRLDVPSVNLTMASPHYHTERDTADRIPAKQLSRAVKAHRDFLSKILSMTREQIRSPI